MGLKTINLSNKAESILATMKENDPEFNFSKFVQDAIEGDDTRLTKEQIMHKRKEAEVQRDEAIALMEHYDTIIPIMEEKKELDKIEKAERMKGSVATLIRKLGEEGQDRYLELLPIHAKMCEVTITELGREVENEKNRLHNN